MAAAKIVSPELIAARARVRTLNRQLLNCDPYRSPENYARLEVAVLAAKAEVARLAGRAA